MKVQELLNLETLAHKSPKRSIKSHFIIVHGYINTRKHIALWAWFGENLSSLENLNSWFAKYIMPSNSSWQSVNNLIMTRSGASFSTNMADQSGKTRLGILLRAKCFISDVLPLAFAVTIRSRLMQSTTSTHFFPHLVLSWVPIPRIALRSVRPWITRYWTPYAKCYWLKWRSISLKQWKMGMVRQKHWLHLRTE